MTELKPEGPQDNVWAVLVIGGNGSALAQVHEGRDHSRAYTLACETLASCEAGEYPGATEVRTVRTDYWGEAHVSGRLMPRPDYPPCPYN